MTSDRIDTAKEREKLAALGGPLQGPWQHKPGSLEHGWDVLEGDPPIGLVAEGIVIEEDARLIAAAPELKATLAAALDALDAKDAEIERMRAVLNDIYENVEYWNTLRISSKIRAALQRKEGNE